MMRNLTSLHTTNSKDYELHRFCPNGDDNADQHHEPFALTNHHDQHSHTF
jgi:hypothetical protein